MHLEAHIDGGARGNPGPAGAGIYFKMNGTPWRGLYCYLGSQTNNYAEYTALLHALEYAVRNGCRSLHVYSDSELLVRQLAGVYRVKSANLQALYARAKDLIARLESFRIRHVPREMNREADALANKAQDLQSSGEEVYQG